ncbi:hypothetical protein TNCV_3752241 [Trichonephila clavipes]|nr:hypothetical protein TNCV_3752241 [Trichonephila clavipes]
MGFSKQTLGSSYLTTSNDWELRLALQDEWAAMPQQLIDTLILSIGRRCETCLAAIVDCVLEEINDGRNENENRVEIETIKLSQLEKELEIAKLHDQSGKNVPLQNENQLIKTERNIEILIKNIKTITIPVPQREEPFSEKTTHEKGLSRVQLISADEICEGKEETSVDVIKETAKEDINPVILSKEPVNLEDDEIEELAKKEKTQKIKQNDSCQITKKVNLKASRNIVLVTQHWSFRREYSRREKLAGKQPDFIKRIDVRCKHYSEKEIIEIQRKGRLGNGAT